MNSVTVDGQVDYRKEQTTTAMCLMMMTTTTTFTSVCVDRQRHVHASYIHTGRCFVGRMKRRREKKMR
jgi:hypothetical protein